MQRKTGGMGSSKPAAGKRPGSAVKLPKAVGQTKSAAGGSAVTARKPRAARSAAVGRAADAHSPGGAAEAATVLVRRKLRLSSTKFNIERQTFRRPGGRLIERDIIVHPGAVVIVPVLDRRTVVLIRNDRPAAGEVLWELPAGTCEPDEEPIETAARELVEETGYRCERIRPLTMFYTTPGMTDERMHAFAADGLTQVGLALEEDEAIVPEAVPIAEALAMASDGRIKDGKSIAALMVWAVQSGWLVAHGAGRSKPRGRGVAARS